MSANVLCIWNVNNHSYLHHLKWNAFSKVWDNKKKKWGTNRIRINILPYKNLRNAEFRIFIIVLLVNFFQISYVMCIIFVPSCIIGTFMYYLIKVAISKYVLARKESIRLTITWSTNQFYASEENKIFYIHTFHVIKKSKENLWNVINISGLAFVRLSNM